MQKGRDEHRLAATTGVRVERNDRHCVVYRGTRAALIASGLARPAHFPEGQRRFSWHFPRTGINWGVRSKGRDVYCLTKLKDGRGVVEAELAAFYRLAEMQARRDTRFQLFLQQIQGDSEDVHGPSGDARRSQPAAALTPTRTAPTYRHPSRSADRPTSGLETLAVATLLVGLTMYLWTRQA